MYLHAPANTRDSVTSVERSGKRACHSREYTESNSGSTMDRPSILVYRCSHSTIRNLYTSIGCDLQNGGDSPVAATPMQQNQNNQNGDLRLAKAQVVEYQRARAVKSESHKAKRTTPCLCREWLLLQRQYQRLP
jgi:hypothetical protein